MAIRWAKEWRACSASWYWDLRDTASRMIVSISGSRRSASISVNRLGTSEAGYLDRHRTAARAVEFGQNDSLPGAQKHAGIADLEGERLPHHHPAQGRVGVLPRALEVAP